MQLHKHFSTDPDTKLDIGKVAAVIGALLALGIMANIVAAARMALS